MLERCSGQESSAQGVIGDTEDCAFPHPPVLRPAPLVWIAVLLLLLLPSPAGRALLDLAGGLLLLLLALPLILGGLGWVGWKFLQQRLVACPTCGAMSLSSRGHCGICGSDLSPQNMDSAPASAMTIDVQAENVDS